MRLASDEITLRIGAEEIHLRPTLRAALRLERRHGGFGKIIEAITDGNVTIMADVIRESSDTRSRIPDLLCEVGAAPLRIGLETLIPPILAHVAALAGVDPDARSEASGEGERITWAERHAQLYRIATGWLGWTPEAAWNATIAEITEAQQGRVELLNALFGTSKNDADNTEGPHFERDEKGWRKLKAVAALGGNKAV